MPHPFLFSIPCEKFPWFPTDKIEEVTDGSVYFAIRGGAFDGHQNISEACRRGAFAIVVETLEAQPVGTSTAIPIQRVTSTREAYAWACAAYFGHPSRSLKLLGVTGTSGKTTTASILEVLLSAAGFRTAFIGTTGIRWGGETRVASHTTPGPREFHGLLREMLDAGVQAVAMEVSSHALDQFRVDGAAYDSIGFLNLTQDHLDYHGTMVEYLRAKSRAFSRLLPSSQKWKSHAKGFAVEGATGTDALVALCRGQSSDVYNIQMVRSEQWGEVSPSGQVRLRLEQNSAAVPLNLFGQFNLENVSMALAMTQDLRSHSVVGTAESYQSALELLKIRGRMELVLTAATQARVFVDYAHKPDALEKTLQLARKYVTSGGRVLIVFGCGGDRDRGKRPLMGRIAEELADVVIVTSDNPRSEDPQKIAQEIIGGMKDPGVCKLELDRILAIKLAIQMSAPNDWVIIAGKGHETVQIIGDEHRPFDDVEVVRSIKGR